MASAFVSVPSSEPTLLYISLVMDAWEPGGRLGILGVTPRTMSQPQLSCAGDSWASRGIPYRVGVSLYTYRALIVGWRETTH